MFSAISFGVFCRSAPSTSAIMRSRKVEPGAAVMRTLIQSESTRVPPVTAERSPPLSRMTGADSPVIADFVDRGDAFDDLAVARDQVAGLDQHDVALLAAAGAGTVCQFAALGDRRAAWPWSRCAPCAGVAACALPRPSATASAKLANSTVNQSQRLIWNEKPRCRRRRSPGRAGTAPWSARRRPRPRTSPGCVTITRGSSLRNDCPIAGRRIAGSNIVDWDCAHLVCGFPWD